MHNAKKTSIPVRFILGSDSDLATIQEGQRVLEDFEIPYRVTVASAHRTPAYLRRVIRQAESEGTKIFIAAAGGAAALPGVVAAETLRPVIGVPIDTPALKGLDSLLSIAQMPGGVPVAAVTIGKAGAKNAALLAVQMLSLSNGSLYKKWANYKNHQRDKLIQRSRKLNIVSLRKQVGL